MALQMRGERIQRRVHIVLIGEPARCRAESAQPMSAQTIIGEQAVHIAAGNLAASRDRAVPAAVGEGQKRALCRRTFRASDMHLVAMEGHVVGKAAFTGRFHTTAQPTP